MSQEDNTPKEINSLSEAFFTRAALAKQLGNSVRTLDRWHAQRIGPPRIKRGKLIL